MSKIIRGVLVRRVVVPWEGSGRGGGVMLPMSTKRQELRGATKHAERLRNLLGTNVEASRISEEVEIYVPAPIHPK